MNRLLTIVTFFTFIAHNLIGQNEKLDSLEISTNQKIIPYVSLTSAFEKYGSFDIGFSKPTKNGNAIGLELGYIYDISAFNTEIPDSWYRNTYGAKAYFYYRFIIQENDPYPFNSKIFVDVEPQIFWASFESERIAGYSCNEEWGDCEYYRFFNSRVERFIPGMNIKLGKIYDYDPFQFTLFMGVGIRQVIEISDLMNDPSPDKIFNKRGQISQLQTGTISNLRLGFQVAYNFWN
ncbi:MAG: hypothetical protein DSY77_04255 [Bacteroidetes bacterium]|jgi:hypothetical protein|nr:MAG: hypothetical protein DSY77_04255 [Bacteroidota bacterium]